MYVLKVITNKYQYMYVTTDGAMNNSKVDREELVHG